MRGVQERVRRRVFPAFSRRGGCADQGPLDSGADGAVVYFPFLDDPFAFELVGVLIIRDGLFAFSFSFIAFSAC